MVMIYGLRDGGEEAADVPGNLYRDVPHEKVDRILDLASRYPSAGTPSLRSSSWCQTSER